MSFKTKLTTLVKTIHQVRNWPMVVGRQLQTRPSEISYLSFRGGLTVAYRPATADWEVVKEVMLYGVYSVCFQYLRGQSDRAPILDLGANIGLFSLQAASCRPGSEVHAYEPAPRNVKLISLNVRANPQVSSSIHIHHEAVGGLSRTASFFYDEKIPQGSSLFHTDRADGLPVTVRSFVEIVDRLGGAVGVVKIDVEGAEYEIFEHTPTRVWEGVPAISIEVHEDPAGKLQKGGLLKRIESLGYKAMKEISGDQSYFLYRGAFPGAPPKP
jgi:FkbM family methyltransferase